jgi:hypothetical protein
MGPLQCDDGVDHVKESQKWDFLNRFVTDFVRMDQELAQAFLQHKIVPKVDIAMKRKGARKCSRYKPIKENDIS